MVTGQRCFEFEALFNIGYSWACVGQAAVPPELSRLAENRLHIKQTGVLGGGMRSIFEKCKKL
jgi:hypothetical protein